jgi:succinoglycan biosynthesis protein ExoM
MTSDTETIDISVVILSYDRVHLLERTLRALFKPSVSQGIRAEVIIVDNHPERLAAPLIEALQAEANMALHYLSDARRNVSIVRNLGINAAKGRYVAFVDDDEAPDDRWLVALHDCLERTGADAAFGPKYPVFETGAAPAWDPNGWRYTLDFKVPTDTPLHMFGRFRRKGKGLGSGNAAFRVATCFDSKEPFAIAFGDGNGEDTHLLFRLALAGRSFVWCAEARVYEFMEASRMQPNYIITRSKRGSQHYATCRIATSDHKVLTWIKVSALGIAQLCVHATLFVVRGEAFGSGHFDQRIGMAKGLGKLTWRKPIGFIDEKAV